MNDIELIAVVDVETTGLSPRHNRIVEIAVLLMSPTGTIQDQYVTLVNPDRDLGPTRIHRITSDEVQHAPKFADVAGDIAERLSRAQILAGHNIRFDQGFLAQEYERLGIAMPKMPIICTCDQFGRNSLAVCCQEVGIMVEGEPHNALFDARVAARLVHHLIEDNSEILGGFGSFGAPWPGVPVRNTLPVSRDLAQTRIAESPNFLQRITSRNQFEIDATESNLLAYLVLIDRVLEDRLIDVDEESTLLDAIEDLELPLSQVTKGHHIYMDNLIVHALADGVVTDTERSDLGLVARLLGLDNALVDSKLESAARQLRKIAPTSLANSTSNDFFGMSVCFTGESLLQINGEPITQALAKEIAKCAGLNVEDNVTKELDLLVVADPNTQSGKAKKARQYGTRIIADPVFWARIGISVD